MTLIGTQENRRAYRELFITAEIGKNISGIILYKETLTQSDSGSTSFVDCLAERNVLPGIKVDTVTPTARQQGSELSQQHTSSLLT